MSEPIKKGDVVQLKSGGPMMTVSTDPENDGIVECVWFDRKELMQQEFPVAALTTNTAP